MLAPALVTATAVDHGMPGSGFLAALFALTGTAVGVLATRAAVQRPEVMLVA